MSEIEIARRCAHCGVTLRQNASFCPQCGEQIGEANIPEPKIAEATATKVPIRENPPPALSSASQPSAVRGRVDKIRHVSSVVIDQAAYDPSLRFILVAAVIFVLFLLLLILSKVIG
jgi:hypothetical protein